jgi:hypothetical protein
MKLHQLPYFRALIADKHRFFRLFERLNSADPSAADELMRSMISAAGQRPAPELYGDMQAVIRHTGYELLSHMEDDECEHSMATVRALCHCGFFSHHELDGLRRITDLIRGTARDDEDALDFLRDELDLFRCPDCNDWEYVDYGRSTYQEEEVCRGCADHNYSYVGRYDNYVHNDSLVRALDESGAVVLVHESDPDFSDSDDAGMRVHYDYEPPEAPVIGNYHSSKSQIRFQRDDWTSRHRRFLGVELEIELVDRYGDRTNKAHQLNELINEGDVGRKVFFENDGSLTNGFEVVTHPMSLPAHRELWKWLQDKGATKGLVSHKSTTCGLHVHVNRDSLTKLQIAKIVAFVNNPANEEFMTALARRYGSAMTGYCRIKAEKAKVGKAADSSDRYEAVNVTPRHTIEFRIFKGTLKYESLVAAIEFVHALCEYTARCGDCSVSDLGYEAFLKFAETKLPKETQTLRSYVSNRLETA